MKKHGKVCISLLVLFLASTMSNGQDNAPKKKTGQSCSASCEGLSGLRKRSFQNSKTSKVFKTLEVSKKN